MKIFLTGSTGVVGRRALVALAGAGHDVTAVARSEAKAEQVRELGGTPVAVDLFDGHAVASHVVGHEAVIHLATNVPPPSHPDQGSAWETNHRLRVEASSHLVDAALAAGTSHYVQESIVYPYVDAGSDWISEDHPVTHVGPFAGAGHAEAAARRFAESGAAGVVLRFGQFYAPDAAHTTSNNDTLRRHALNPFVGHPDAFLSLIHAEDAGAAVVLALDAPSGVYNVVDDEPIARGEAGRVAARALGLPPPTDLPEAERLAMPPEAHLMMRSQRIANRRFKDATGWAPVHRSIRGSWPVD